MSERLQVKRRLKKYRYAGIRWQLKRLWRRCTIPIRQFAQRGRNSPFWWLVLGGFSIRAGYTFALTEYEGYLFSDMGGYWIRALERFDGLDLITNQWALWPPAYHILLSWLFHIFDQLGLDRTHWLEATLTLQMILGAFSGGWVYLIAHHLMRHSWALATGVAYMLTYQIFYLNAFILSENVAMPLLIGAILVLVRRGRSWHGALATGLILGTAVVVRPAFGTFGLPFALYLLGRTPWLQPKRILLTALLTTAFFSMVGLVSAETHRISGGKVTGLAANGGLNFFIGQCKYKEVVATFGRYTYGIGPPQFVAEDFRDTYKSDVPFYEQNFYYNQGFKCIASDDWSLLEHIWELRKMFVGPLLPSMVNAWGFHEGLPYVTFWLTSVMLLAFFVSPWFWKHREDHDTRGGVNMLWLLWSLLLLTTLGGLIFSIERRYSFPMTFAAYILVAAMFENIGKAKATSKTDEP